MLGDQSDFVARLKAVLPGGWFPDKTPILDGVLNGSAAGWAYCYALLAFTRLQTRRLTASGVFLDMIAADFFGGFIRRRVNETDALLSQRIGRELFREKGTRAGVIAALTDLTGRAPALFEPAYPLDTGAYAAAGPAAAARPMGCGYGVAGGYGSLALPFQFFLTAYRPVGQGVASVAAYGNRAAGVTAMPGGYGMGAIEYANPSMFAPLVADNDILAVINDVRPAATIAWTRITGASASNVSVFGQASGTNAGGGTGTGTGGIVGGGGSAIPGVSGGNAGPVVTPTPTPTPAPVVANLLPGGSTNPPAPATITGNFAVAGWTYQTYNGAAYIIMLPANYDPTKRYPLVVWLSTDDDGNAYYQGGVQADQSYGVAAKFGAYFQAAAFQRNFPCVFIAPLLNQTSQTTDGAINYGGHAYFGGDQLAPHRGIIALIKNIVSQYPIDTARVYSAGASLGADGTVCNMMLDNTINGTEQSIFAAGLALSPVDFDIISTPDNGATWAVNAAAVTQMQGGIALGCIHGASDQNHPASYMSLPLFKALGGTGGNASGMPWTQAGSSNYFLLIDPALGHDTWDTYLTGNNLLTYFGWLFSHTAAGVPVSYTVSPSGATAGPPVISMSAPGSLTDASGNVWALSSAGIITENGATVSDPVATRSLLLVGGSTVWVQSNSDGSWYTYAAGNFSYQSAPPPVVAPGTITDAAGNAWAINGAGQVVVNGVADPTTANVLQLAYVGGLIYQENASLNWWSKTQPSGTWTPTGNPLAAAPVAGTYHSVANGKIYTPSGAVFHAKGINLTDGAMGSASAILSLFPGLNFVRVACFSYQAPSAYASFITTMNAAGVIVALENHQNFNADGSSAGNYGGGQGYCNTGSILQTEVNWYAALATYYKGNPNLWFMTTNEPAVNPSVAALSTWHDAIIGAIRNTGNNTIVMVDVNNPYTWGSGGGMTASVYAKYHNLVWDPHFYGWLWTDNGQIGGGGYSTNTATINAQMAQGVQLLQTITSADGIIPCIVGEFGDSTDGPDLDANGGQNVSCVLASVGTLTQGCCAWLYDDLGTAYHDQLQHGGVLTSYGQTVAHWIAS